jgi:hypothetical protein
MASIVVGAGLARRPLNGGAPWARLQWVFGLRQLGFDVYLVDQLDRESCVDARGAIAPLEGSLNLAYFRQIVEMFGLSGRAALIYGDGDAVEGAAATELLDYAETADLLINIGGKLGWEPLLRRSRRKVFVDIDPGFTQLSGRAQSGQSALEGYDSYFTIGHNIGSDVCTIPTNGIPWRPIRPPVALEHWPVSTDGESTRFTTIAAWQGRPLSREHEGRTFGLKAAEFRKFAKLPTRVEEQFEIVLNLSAPKPLLPDDPYPPALDQPLLEDVELLRRHGWQLVDPRIATPDPLAFRSYVQQAGAEFSAAKGIYVETGSGWFSDRSVCYLASGKPVLVQDTGFGRTLPVGEGLLSFRTLEDAVEGARRISGDYPAHCAAARAIAEKYFASDVVLGRLLEESGVTT